MGKQSKSRKPEILGKGKVTPVQIAFIVDRYLSDNGYTQSRATFRSEASTLIAKSPVQEAPRSLLTLGAILDEYITLKEQKVLVDQERTRLEQEKARVQSLLSAMQDAMNAYNAGGSSAVTPTPPPPAVPSGHVASQAERAATPSAGYYPLHTSPAIVSTSKPLCSQKDSTVFSTPVMYNTTTKRKGARDASDGLAVSKRPRRGLQSKEVNQVTQTSTAGENHWTSQSMNSATQSIVGDKAPSGSQVLGSSVVKCLFNQEPESSSPPNHSSVPKTPPRALSLQTEKSKSTSEIGSTATSSKDGAPQLVTSNRTIISSEMVHVSPTKQIAYYTIEKSSISMSSPLKKLSPFKPNCKRSDMKDHVKGRLDFSTSEIPVITEDPTHTPECNTTSESEREGDILDLDFPILDTFGLDFNLSEFLNEFDIGTEGMGFSSEQALGSSPDSNSGLSPVAESTETYSTQFTPQFPSNMTEVLGEKDMNLVGTDSIEAMHSVTRCIRIVSPVKCKKNNLDQDNCPGRE